MTRAALFVDLPNFYSHLLKSGIEEPRFLRDYFLHWLDLDLLAYALAGEVSGIWVFYSGERIGPSDQRIVGSHLKDYIARINALEGVTAWDVNIQGEQREPFKVRCESCGKEAVIEWISEKGIDASLTVHLFDTMDSWDVAYLLSGDADYVPAVASLRRRGKIVKGAGFPDQCSSALIRECYDYIDLSASAQGHQTATSLADFSSREKQIEEFKTKHPHQVENARPEEPSYKLQVGPLAWDSIKRRLGAFESLIENSIGFPENVERNADILLCTACYRYDRDAGRYECVPQIASKTNNA